MFAFEKALICHCSPTLSGLKPANLLSLSKADYPDLPMLIESYSDILAPKGVSLDIVCECGHRWLLLVYRPAYKATAKSCSSFPSLRRRLPFRGQVLS